MSYWILKHLQNIVSKFQVDRSNSFAVLRRQWTEEYSWRLFFKIGFCKMVAKIFSKQFNWSSWIFWLVFEIKLTRNWTIGLFFFQLEIFRKILRFFGKFDISREIFFQKTNLHYFSSVQVLLKSQVRRDFLLPMLLLEVLP